MSRQNGMSRTMRSLMVISSILVAAVALPRAAEAACECQSNPVSLLAPHDGATGVPTNTRVLIAAERVGESKWAADDATLQTPPLTVAPLDKKGKPGAPVDSSVSMMSSAAYGTVFSITPKKPLKPNTGYALVRLEAPKKRKVKEQYATFTTGAAADTVPPVFSGLDKFSVMISHQQKTTCHTTQPPYRQIIWQIGDVTDEGTPLEELIRIFYVQRKGEVRTVRLIEPATAPATKINGTKCDAFRPRFDKDEEVCGVVEIVDLAGNVAGAGVEKCMAAKKM